MAYGINAISPAQPVYITDATGADSGTTTNPQRTAQQGSTSMATGQIPVTTSATLVVAARAGRAKVTLSPTTAVVYYTGNTGVTSANGLFVAAGGVVTLDTAAAVYAVGASAVTISYVEFF